MALLTGIFGHSFTFFLFLLAVVLVFLASSSIRLIDVSVYEPEMRINIIFERLL